MDFLIALSIIIFFTNSALGLFVYFGNKKDKINQLYFLNTIALAAWIFGVILKYQTAQLIFFKINFTASSFIALFFFYFCYFFPRKTIIFSKAIHAVILALMGGMIGFSMFTRLIASDVGFTASKEIWYKFGQLYPAWAILFLLFFGSGLLILVRKYKKSKGIEKLQIKYFFIGAVLSAMVSMTTNLFFPLLGVPIDLWQYGPLALIFMMVFMTYSITKHHLMNLKIIATELLVGLMIVMLLMDLLLAKSVSAALMKLAILLTFGYLGMSLIKSVLQEIERREEIEKMSWKLQRAYQELKKLDEAKSEFIAMASHQLRTPLSIVKGFVSMLLEGSYGKTPEKFKRPLTNVFESNERLIKIVNNLLDISKIDLGKTEISKEKVQIEDLIGQVVQEFAGEAEKKKIYLKWEKPEPALPKIEVDSLRIRQAIMCVIDNAIKYTEKGGITVKIQNLKSKIQIIISDTGVGMTETEIKRAFESFTRGAAGLRLWIQGTGLGLYLAQRYIDLHNGKIWVKSAGVGKGTTFYIELLFK